MIGDDAVIDGTDEIAVVGYSEVIGVTIDRTNKMCAILGNLHRYKELMPLTESRPLSSLLFDLNIVCLISTCQVLKMQISNKCI